jgi:hypothetical protein
MQTQPPSDHARDLRYALDVLEEYSHLGLDDEYANKLREILERQLGETDEDVSCSQAQPVRFPRPAE